MPMPHTWYTEGVSSVVCVLCASALQCITSHRIEQICFSFVFRFLFFSHFAQRFCMCMCMCLVSAVFDFKRRVRFHVKWVLRKRSNTEFTYAINEHIFVLHVSYASQIIYENQIQCINFPFVWYAISRLYCILHGFTPFSATQILNDLYVCNMHIPLIASDKINDCPRELLRETAINYWLCTCTYSKQLLCYNFLTVNFLIPKYQ